MVKIAFFDSKSYDKESFEAMNQSYGFEMQFFETHLNEHTVHLAQGFDVVCAFVNDILNQKVIETLDSFGIKLIAMRCAGYNNVDLKAAKEHIPVVNVPTYSPHAVAEHTVALMLCLNRKIHRAYVRTRDNNFSIEGLLGFDMFGKSVGIIGYGRIGHVVADILKGFGMDVHISDPFVPNCEKFETILKECDIITLHAPLTPETHHLINRNSIAKMKDGVMLINTSRGALINTHDLINALKSKKISACALDVYEEESAYFFEDFSQDIISDDTLARLQTFPNVIITSHQAFFTQEALHNIAKTTLDSIKEYFEKKQLEHRVT